MTSPVINKDKEDGIQAFEKVLQEVRMRNDRPFQPQDRAVFPHQVHGSRTPQSSNAACSPEFVTTDDLVINNYRLVSSAIGNHGGNQPLNILHRPSVVSPPPLHPTEIATSVNRTLSPFQRQLPFDAKQQSSSSINDSYGIYPETAMTRNMSVWPHFAGDSTFQRQVTPLYHMMQPWNKIGSLPSAISLNPSHAFSEISHHVETRTGRSPDCQSTSDSSLPGDTGSGPFQDERKARNRVAAMKCRAKKLEQIRRLEKRVTDLRNLNMDLQKQVISLRGEIQSLHFIYLQHRNSGCCI